MSVNSKSNKVTCFGYLCDLKEDDHASWQPLDFLNYGGALHVNDDLTF